MIRRIALDLDSTVAATAEVAFDLLCGPEHDYSYDDVEDWTWGFREFGKEAYLSALWHAWTLRSDEIEPTERDIIGKVHKLNHCGAVDIVTAHPGHLGITKGKRQWLENNGIRYDSFRVVEPNQTKANLDYDVYIDDKPVLPERIDSTQHVYLYDQRYNRTAAGDYTRVESLSDVIEEERSRRVATV